VFIEAIWTFFLFGLPLARAESEEKGGAHLDITPLFQQKKWHGI